MEDHMRYPPMLGYFLFFCSTFYELLVLQF